MIREKAIEVVINFHSEYGKEAQARFYVLDIEGRSHYLSEDGYIEPFITTARKPRKELQKFSNG